MDWQLKLIDKRDEAQGTKSFIFEKPQGFFPKTGDFLYFDLEELNYPDPRGKTRHFTLSSSPTEDYISFTCRMREQSGYKKTFDELPMGTLVKARGPQGIFDFPEKDGDKPEVMIAGGIGITPYRCRIKYITDKNLNTPVHLLYANSVPEQITFKKELDEISQTNPHIKVTYFISDPDKSQEKWDGRVGRIDEASVRELVSDIPNTIFWVCGPPPMVDAVEELLTNLGATEDLIRTEKFTGY
jgi:glycine betaine catabolism B